MFLPKEIVLLHYLPRNTYLDKKSKERNANRIKYKYKLLFKNHKDLDVWVFFVLNSSNSACVREMTFIINENDWEERIGKYLEAENSYIDIQKCITMNTDEVFKKAQDGFVYTGKLSQNKFTDLGNLLKKYVSSANQKTDFKVRNMLKEIILDKKPNEFIKKFGV